MAVLDCMLLNALQLWNMSCDKVPGRKKLARYEFINTVSHELQNYKTDTEMSPAQNQEEQHESAGPVASDASGQRRRNHVVEQVRADVRCRVCQLEAASFRTEMKKLKIPITQEIKQKVEDSKKGNRKHVSLCRHCGMHAHNAVMVEGPEKFLRKFFEDGMTCMDILHSRVGKEIWVKQPSGRYSVKYKHQVVQDLGKVVKDFLEKDE